MPTRWGATVARSAGWIPSPPPERCSNATGTEFGLFDPPPRSPAAGLGLFSRTEANRDLLRPLQQPGSVQPLGHRSGSVDRAGPAPFVDRADLGVGADGGDVAEEQSQVELVAQCGVQLCRPSNAGVPGGRAVGDVLQVPPAIEQGGCRLRTPAGHAGKAVCRVADESQEIRHRLRQHTETGTHTGSVEPLVLTAVPLPDLAADALAEVLVGGTDDRPLDAVVGRRGESTRSQRVVRLLLDHRPHGEAE